MLEEEGAVIVGLLVGLNVIDANLCVKGEDLDSQVTAAPKQCLERLKKHVHIRHRFRPNVSDDDAGHSWCALPSVISIISYFVLLHHTKKIN